MLIPVALEIIQDGHTLLADEDGQDFVRRVTL